MPRRDRTTRTPARTVHPGATIRIVALVAAGGRRIPIDSHEGGLLHVDPDGKAPFLIVGMDYEAPDGSILTAPPVAARPQEDTDG